MDSLVLNSKKKRQVFITLSHSTYSTLTLSIGRMIGGAQYCRVRLLDYSASVAAAPSPASSGALQAGSSKMPFLNAPSKLRTPS